MDETELANMQASFDLSAQREEARRQTIEDILPTWHQVETACDSISNLAEAKVYLKRLSKVVFWLAKNVNPDEVSSESPSVSPSESPSVSPSESNSESPSISPSESP